MNQYSKAFLLLEKAEHCDVCSCVFCNKNVLPVYRVPTGQGKLEKNQRIYVVTERPGKNIIFEKSGKSDLGSCRLQISVIFISEY